MTVNLYIHNIKRKIIRGIFNSKGDICPPIKLEEIKNVLILQNRHIGIGDLALSTGALFKLASKYPNINFTYLTIPAGLQVYYNFPSNVRICIFENKLFFFGENIIRNIKQLFSANWHGIINNIILLRKNNYDLALTNRSSTIEFIFMLLYGAKYRLGFPTYAGENILTHKIMRKAGHEHIAYEWNDIAEYLTLEEQIIRPVIFPSQNVSDKLRDDLILCNKLNPSLQTVLIHSGASTLIRKWGINKFCRVIEKCDKESKFNRIWFVDDSEIIIVKNTFGENEVIFHIKGSLQKLISAIHISDIYLGNDSGPMHLASALDKIIISIFGPTEKKYYRPFANKAFVLQEDVCNYRPCFDKCKYQTPICMEAVTVEHVYGTLMKVFELSAVKV